MDLRTAWRHEALNFTPWLAENLDRLSQAVSIEMSLEDTEVQIDRFSADILARNAKDDSLAAGEAAKVVELAILYSPLLNGNDRPQEATTPSSTSTQASDKTFLTQLL